MENDQLGLRRIDRIRKLALGSSREPLTLEGDNPSSEIVPVSTAIDVHLFDHINLKVLEIHLTDTLTKVGRTIIKRVKKCWLEPLVGENKRLLMDLSYEGINGEIGNAELVSVYTLHQPDHTEAEGFTVRKLILKGSMTLDEATGDVQPMAHTANRMDRLLRNRFQDSAGNALACRKVSKLPPLGRERKITIGAQEFRALMVTPPAWCRDSETNLSCLCETQDVVARFTWNKFYHWIDHDNDMPEDDAQHDEAGADNSAEKEHAEDQGVDGGAVEDEGADDEGADDEGAEDENGGDESADDGSVEAWTGEDEED